MSGGKDNTYPIYIRVTHLRQVGYIKTNKVCKAKFVRNGDITDPYIIKDVYVQIEIFLRMTGTLFRFLTLAESLS